MPETQSKVHFGLENLTIWFESATEEGGYEAPIHVPGVVGFNRTAQTEKSKFFADNLTYFVTSNDKGDEGDLETAGIPKAVLARMLGWAVDTNGALVRVTDGRPAAFAMGYQVQGDADERGKVCYRCQASVPDESNKTLGDSVEVQTESVKVDIMPKVIGGHKVVSATLDKADSPTQFANFFTKPYVPAIPGA